MNNPILNRPAAKRRVAVAMITAIAIHLSAVGIASFRHEPGADENPNPNYIFTSGRPVLRNWRNC
jgi:hypothetical protein